MAARPIVNEPEDYADLDGTLLPLALEFAEGSAGDFLELAQARYDVHHFVVARWLWSAWQRGLIAALDEHYSRFSTVADEAQARLAELEGGR